MSGSTTTPPSLRNNGLTLFTQSAIADADKSPPWPEPPGGTDEPPRPDQHDEATDTADNMTSPVPATQRKLPIPHSGANSNANLKGILIKPKRILPAQPDTSKVKRPPQDGVSQLNLHVTDGETLQSEINHSSQEAKDKSEFCPKQTKLPKLQIDVDRLKTYFLTHSNEGTDAAKKSLANDSEPGIKKSTAVRLHSGYSPHTHYGRESTLYNFSPDGLSKVREWCSQSEINKMTSKMASDIVKDRNIRSPSPKSNTTWERSSSGYSSDERADPRSPPPRETASAISKQESNHEDDGVSVNDSKCEKEDSVAMTALEKEESAISDQSSNTVEEVNSDKVGSGGGEVTGVDNECSSNVCSCTTSEGANNVDKIDQIQNTVPAKDDTVTPGSNVSNFDNSLGQKQTNNRRPAWPLAAPPASGRIQYRKSGSESVISLRHPSRQGVNGDNSFDGLEVCGRSYPHTPSATTKTDSSLVESARTDCGAIPEINISPSAFSPVEKVTPTPPETLTELVPKLDITKQDSAFKTRIMRQQFVPPRSPRDIKSLSLSLAGKLTIARDEKDIRKTLHDLNTPRRSPCGKTAPIRARHIIHPTSGNPNQPMSATDTAAGQPVGLAFTSFQRINTNSDNKQTVKFFGKKMWRQPQGQPENAQMRPFSPFGGTLPPSKIKENEQKRHDQD